jgi:hypothetical protein
MKRLVWHIGWAAGLALLILAAGCLLRLVAVQRSSITKLRHEVDSLRVQLEAAELAGAGRAESRPARLPEEQLRELLRLRGKAGLFRSQAEELAHLDSKPLSEEEVALTFFVKGREQVMKVVAKRIGAEWKFYGGLTF